MANLDLSHPLLDETFSYLEKKKIPLVIHSGTAPLPGEFTGIKYFSPFINRFPNLKVIVAHMGTYEIEEYLSAAREFENIMLDTTMVFVDFLATGLSLSDYIDDLEELNNKVFFGSDFPNIPYHYSHPITNILKSKLSKETKQNILYKNFLTFFDLPK